MTNNDSNKRQRFFSTLREIAHDQERPLEPSILEESDLIFRELIHEFGSVAAASIKAGVDYYNPDPRQMPIAILGENWSDRSASEQQYSPRMELLRDLRTDFKIFNESWRLKRCEKYATEAAREFGTLDAAILEAGVDYEIIDEWTPTSKYIRRLQKAADDLGTPPTKDYERIPASEKEGFLHRFGTWESALRAAGLNPEKQSRQTELALYIRELADQIGHPPNKREIAAYRNDIDEHERPSVESYESVFENLEDGWRYAGLPAHRDLQPERDLYSQTVAEGLPTHIDLLQDLFHVCCLAKFEEGQTVADALTLHGTIEERHFTIQFGSLETAVEIMMSNYI